MLSLKRVLKSISNDLSGQTGHSEDPTALSEITIAVHDGEFHADDVFAVASLMILHSKGNQKVRVVRTRDRAVLDVATYVADVGEEYDPSRNRFDHHQQGGAGVRQNGISYAGFGLVWKTYGVNIAGSVEVAKIIEDRLVTPLDAVDNGIDISKSLFGNLGAYGVSSVISIMNPTWEEVEEEGNTNLVSQLDGDGRFMQAVEIAQTILAREIAVAHSRIRGEKIAVDAYRKSPDKRIIVLDAAVPWAHVFADLPEPLFVVYPKPNMWRIKAVRNNQNSFESCS